MEKTLLSSGELLSSGMSVGVIGLVGVFLSASLITAFSILVFCCTSYHRKSRKIINLGNKTQSGTFNNQYRMQPIKCGPCHPKCDTKANESKVHGLS